MLQIKWRMEKDNLLISWYTREGWTYACKVEVGKLLVGEPKSKEEVILASMTCIIGVGEINELLLKKDLKMKHGSTPSRSATRSTEFGVVYIIAWFFRKSVPIEYNMA